MEQEQKERILYLRDVMKLSFRQIGEQIGVSRKSVSRRYQGEFQKSAITRPSVLDKYYSLIADWFREYPSLSAKQVYTWLKDRNVTVSYTWVVKYTRQFRKKQKRVYHHLDFLPGEEGQVDWFFVSLPNIGKLAGFAIILSYSRYLFAHMFPRSSFEFFLEGHLMALQSFGGIPHNLRYDNLKSVVLRRKPCIEYNPRFLEFCRHYKTGIRLCNPASGNEKGRVERVIRSIKEAVFNSTSNYSSIESVNYALHKWVENKNNTIHRSTRQRPAILFKEERLKPLPAIAWKNESIHPPAKTTKTGMMIFDTNSYSIPDYLTGKSLSIHSTPTAVIIYDKDKKVASHPRSYKRYEKIINPVHRSFSRMSQTAKMQRIYEVIRRMDLTIDRFLTQNQICGEDPQKTAYEIFKLLRANSRGMLISVVSECLKRKSARVKTVVSYLNKGQNTQIDTVHPKNIELLQIDYKKRSLEEYDDEEKY